MSAVGKFTKFYTEHDVFMLIVEKDVNLRIEAGNGTFLSWRWLIIFMSEALNFSREICK